VRIHHWLPSSVFSIASNNIVFLCEYVKTRARLAGVNPNSVAIFIMISSCLFACERYGDCMGYTLPRAIAHAASKRQLVAKHRPAGWTPPGMFRLPEALTEAEVIEAEAELRALQRHALEVVDPES
jgi:hypothetical protein